MDTRERTRIVCERVTRRIGEVVPAGLGRWDPAWSMVEAPSDSFLDALRAWGALDTPVTRERLQETADELVRAWRRAGQAWETSGGPTEEPAHA